MLGSPSNLEPRYDVVLVSAGTRPRRVAQTIASFTDLRREEAWELLRRAPELILQGASYATAEGARQALERRGATVELRAYDVEVPEPAPNSSEPPRREWQAESMVPDQGPSSPSKAIGFVFIAMVIIFVLAIIVLSIISSGLSSLSGICNPDCL
jgi:hypothetical protein